MTKTLIQKMVTETARGLMNEALAASQDGARTTDNANELKTISESVYEVWCNLNQYEQTHRSLEFRAEYLSNVADRIEELNNNRWA